ncbi:MAG: hypothetical protein IKL66_03090 [Clostridia bacterium]|nr:hypothetical protein [Clostridia bacterium]
MRNKGLLRILCISFALCMFATFVSCKKNDKHAFGKDVTTLVMHITVDNRDSAYNSLKNAFTEEEFDTRYDKWRQMLGNAPSVTTKMISYNTSSDGDVEITECSLGVYTPSGNFIVSAVKRSDVEGFSSFSLEPDVNNSLPEYEED